MNEVFEKELNSGLDGLSLALTDVQKELLFRYYEMVIEKNRVMNLTAITEEADFVRKNLVDSLALVLAGPGVRKMLEKPGAGLIDVGTGAGFPGLVLKIAFPELRVTLADSLQKRLTFLEEVIGELKLSGVSTVHGRAEDLARDKKLRESFDLVTARAVADLSVLSEYCLPFAVPGGCFVSYKSGSVEEEYERALYAAGLLGGEPLEPVKYLLPGTDIARSLVVIRKTRKTPPRYPRKAGTPGKEPLKKKS